MLGVRRSHHQFWYNAGSLSGTVSKPGRHLPTPRRGDPMRNSLTQKRIDFFIWRNVEIRGPEDCWEWRKAVNSGGYAWFNGKTLGTSNKVSRAVYQITHGDLDPEMYVLHSCDNRRCCNPLHLRQGTPLDNSRDMLLRGRHVPNRQRKVDEKTRAYIRSYTGNIKQLSRDLRLSRTTIYRIKHEKP